MITGIRVCRPPSITVAGWNDIGLQAASGEPDQAKADHSFSGGFHDMSPEREKRHGGQIRFRYRQARRHPFPGHSVFL
jgi:hypothetical protein